MIIIIFTDWRTDKGQSKRGRGRERERRKEERGKRKEERGSGGVIIIIITAWRRRNT